LKRWQFWLGMAISALFLYKAMAGLHLAATWAVLEHAQYLWLIPAVLVYFVAVWFRTWRWHYLLRPLGKVPLPELFPVVCIGYMGNNVYPFRIGELIRSYVLRRRTQISMSASLATIIVERVLDGLVMLLFVFVALPFSPMPSEYRNAVIFFSVLFLGALVVFLWLAAQPDKATAAYRWFGERFLPERWHLKLDPLVGRFLTGLHSLRRGEDVLLIFFTSVLIWLTETGKYWVVMHAFPFHVSFITLMLMNGIVNLATTLPSAPGYVGTFDTPGIEVLVAFNVRRSVATGYTFVLHAALWLPITLLGAYYMWRENISWSDFSHASAAEET